MKQSELTQLYVLLNKFRDEYIKCNRSKINEAFDIVDDVIDHTISKESRERTINLI